MATGQKDLLKTSAWEKWEVEKPSKSNILQHTSGIYRCELGATWTRPGLPDCFRSGLRASAICGSLIGQETRVLTSGSGLRSSWRACSESKWYELSLVDKAAPARMTNMSDMYDLNDLTTWLKLRFTLAHRPIFQSHDTSCKPSVSLPRCGLATLANWNIAAYCSSQVSGLTRWLGKSCPGKAICSPWIPIEGCKVIQILPEMQWSTIGTVTCNIEEGRICDPVTFQAAVVSFNWMKDTFSWWSVGFTQLKRSVLNLTTIRQESKVYIAGSLSCRIESACCFLTGSYFLDDTPQCVPHTCLDVGNFWQVSIASQTSGVQALLSASPLGPLYHLVPAGHSTALTFQLPQNIIWAGSKSWKIMEKWQAGCQIRINQANLSIVRNLFQMLPDLQIFQLCPQNVLAWMLSGCWILFAGLSSSGSRMLRMGEVTVTLEHTRWSRWSLNVWKLFEIGKHCIYFMHMHKIAWSIRKQMKTTNDDQKMHKTYQNISKHIKTSITSSFASRPILFFFDGESQSIVTEVPEYCDGELWGGCELESLLRGGASALAADLSLGAVDILANAIWPQLGLEEWKLKKLPQIGVQQKQTQIARS